MRDRLKPRSPTIFAIDVSTTIMLMKPKCSGSRNRARISFERTLEPLLTAVPTAFHATPLRISRFVACMGPAATSVTRSETGAAKHYRDRAEEQPKVLCIGFGARIVAVELSPRFERSLVAAADLPGAGDSGLDRAIDAESLGIEVGFVSGERSRPDDAHLA